MYGGDAKCMDITDMDTIPMAPVLAGVAEEEEDAVGAVASEWVEDSELPWATVPGLVCLGAGDGVILMDTVQARHTTRDTIPSTMAQISTAIPTTSHTPR